MILIPSSIGVFILARPILYILRPDYTKVTEIAQLLIISQIIQLLSFVAQSSLLGMETADINNNRSFHELKKSLLIRVPTINIISNAFYIIGVTIASLAFSLINSLIIYIIILSLIYIISQTFNTYILWHMLSKKVKIKLNHQPIIKYLIASIIMGIVLFYVKKIIKFTSVYETAPEVLITIGIGAITYIIILYAISKEFRSLTKVTINEIRQSLRK